MENKISIYDILHYEIRSSWWTKMVSNKFLQQVAGKYFAAKTKIKYRRYENNIKPLGK